MAYTDIDRPTDYFRTKLYTGNGADGQVITYDESENMTPNFVWIKERNATSAHKLIDSVRGADKAMSADQTEAERTHQYLADFNDANGFTIGTTDGGTNQNNNTFASWNWKAGTSFSNDASGTGIGSIDSAGSVSTDAGFSIVSYTGTGSAGTVKHGLSTTPSTIIHKRRDAESGWVVWHKSIGTNILELNETGAAQSGSSYINGTVPTSSVFSINTSGDINADSGTYIAYCFNNVQGYSKFGSYLGNGNADGTFIYTGFKTAFLIVKNTTEAGNGWQIFDNKRDTFNVATSTLFANLNNAEGTDTSFDVLSNGIKMRQGFGSKNKADNVYIYMAFAEQPFVTSTGVPATAR